MTSWFVVHARPGGEERAVENLLRQGYAAYLPTLLRVRSHARRREAVRRPLFPRYLFVGFDPAVTPWRPILSTAGVSDLVRGGGRPLPVPGALVDEIRERERGGGFDVDPAVSRLRPGDPVRIASGPFADAVARFVAMRDAERVTVLLGLLGREVSACVGAGELAPA